MNAGTPIDGLLERVLRADVRGLHGYAVQPSAGLIKLDTMENPYRLEPALQAELGARLGRVAINRYPAERIDELRAALAQHARMPEGCALTLGNGSDELISMLTLACDRPGGHVLAPQPSFVMYELAARLQGLPFTGVPLRADFDLDLPAMLAAIERVQPTLLWLACPNNPTANLWDEAAIETLVRAAPGLVVLDEAYQPFAARDGMALLARHPQVLVMRTLSKFGLAGVRIGYLMGARALVEQIDKLRPPFNVGVLNAEAALFALEHAEVYARQARAIVDERARLLRELATLPAVQAFASQANMILVRVPDAGACFAGMKARGVLVKNVQGLHPLLAGCLRLTVGTPAENDAMLAALRNTLQEIGRCS
jgi:histidinol-phosphate aminotransferase